MLNVSLYARQHVPSRTRYTPYMGGHRFFIIRQPPHQHQPASQPPSFLAIVRPVALCDLSNTTTLFCRSLPFQNSTIINTPPPSSSSLTPPHFLFFPCFLLLALRLPPPSAQKGGIINIHRWRTKDLRRSAPAPQLGEEEDVVL